MKLFTTRKHNTVAWPKLHNLQNEIYKFFRGIHPRSLYLVLGALRLGLPSSPLEIFVTIGLGISVSENDIYVILVLGNFVFGNYTCPSQGMIQRDGQIHPTYLKKLNLPLNVSQKKYALECKANFIDNYF